MWEVTRCVCWPWRCLRRESLSFFFGRGEWKSALASKDDGLTVCLVFMTFPGCMGWHECLIIAGDRMGESGLCSGARALRWKPHVPAGEAQLELYFVPHFSLFINKAKNQGFQGHRSPKFLFSILLTRWQVNSDSSFIKPEKLYKLAAHFCFVRR